LTFGQVNNKSMMGTVQFTDAEADRIITSGIAVFVRAYGLFPPLARTRVPYRQPLDSMNVAL